MTRPAAAYWVMFPTATPANPATVKVSDMFTLMPYENSLVVLNMNGPQIKKVLERAYYYYKYVPGYGGYSYYTTCMIDTNSVGKITYAENPAAYDPARSYVVSLTINGQKVDFADASKFYRVSTVNYLAAGSCNFNDGGVSLWPLNQIANDTQYYVRDAVIDYITDMATVPPYTVSPAIEGRLNFAGSFGPSLTSLSPVHAWIGLKNSDDQGARFDLKAELKKNGVTIATGLQRCIRRGDPEPVARQGRGRQLGCLRRRAGGTRRHVVPGSLHPDRHQPE